MGAECNIFEREPQDGDELCTACEQRPASVWSLCPACFVGDDE